MSNYKITEIRKLDIYNIYGTVHAVLEKENLEVSENKFYSLCEAEFKYGPGREEIIDLNGEELFRYVEGLKLDWKVIEDLTRQS